MLAALKIILAVFTLGVILPVSGCLIMIYADSKPNESQRSAERTRQIKFDQWNRKVKNLPICTEVEKTDDELKQMYYEKIVDHSKLPKYKFDKKELAEKYEIVRDESHAPHSAYLSYEEYIRTNGQFIKIHRGDTGRLAKKGFQGTFIGPVRTRVISTENILYQWKKSSTRPVPGQSSDYYYFDNCGRFIHVENPNEIRID